MFRRGRLRSNAGTGGTEDATEDTTRGEPVCEPHGKLLSEVRVRVTGTGPPRISSSLPPSSRCCEAFLFETREAGPLAAFVFKWVLLLLELLPLWAVVMLTIRTRSGWCLACRRREGLCCWRGTVLLCCAVLCCVFVYLFGMKLQIYAFRNFAASRVAANLDIKHSRLNTV